MLNLRTEEALQKQKEILDKKIKLVSKTLSKPFGWYSGLPIKKFIKKRVFDLLENFQNPSIEAGRWSAYSHNSAVVGFENLLEKNGVGQGSVVLVHPLLPAKLVDILKNSDVTIKTLDIEKSTLNWSKKSYESFFSGDQDEIDLVIFYNFNGLYQEVIEQVNFNQKKSTPSIVFANNQDLNFSLLSLFETLNLGSILWRFGESFMDKQLSENINFHFKSGTWFLSWHIESRTFATLEYNLSDSRKVYEELLLAYFYFLIQDYEKFDLQSKVKTFFLKNTFLYNEIKTEEEANQKIAENYNKITGTAIPDVFFEIENEIEEYQNILPQSSQQILDKDSSLQTSSKSLYSYFSEQINKRPENSLEVTDFYTGRTYLNYFFYTNQIDYWIENFSSKGVEIYSLSSDISRLFSSNERLENLRFVSKYLLYLSTSEVSKIELN